MAPGFIHKWRHSLPKPDRENSNICFFKFFGEIRKKVEIRNAGRRDGGTAPEILQIKLLSKI
jgi:hypothetical protein